MSLPLNYIEQFSVADGTRYFAKKNGKGQVVYARLNCGGAKNSGSTPVSLTEYKRARRRPDSTAPKPSPS